MKRQSFPYVSSPSSKGFPLSMGTPRKFWCRIDYSSDVINETVLIEYDEMDTVDDFKTKIFNKLNKTRWASENDNASIAIGFYQRRKYNANNIKRLNLNTIKNDNDYKEKKRTEDMESTSWKTNGPYGTYNKEKCNYRELESPVLISPQRETNARIESKNKDEDFNMESLSNQISALNNIEFNSNDNTLINNNSQREYITSPNLALPNHLNITSVHGISSHSSFHSNKKDSPIFSPPLIFPYDITNTFEGPSVNSLIKHTHMSAPSSPLHTNYLSPKKRLKYKVHDINDDLSRIIFEPDQLMSDIYSDLFKAYGRQQSVSEPLLVFSSKDLSLGTKFTPDQTSINMFNAVNSNTLDEGSSKDSLPVDKFDRSLSDNYSEESITRDLLKPTDVGDANEIESNITNMDYDDTKSTTGKYTIENTRSNQETIYSVNSEEYPRQGVLLIPKGYYDSNEVNQQRYHGDMGNENQTNIIVKMDDDDSSGENEVNLSLMYKDNRPLFLANVSDSVPITNGSIEIDKIKTDLITPEEQHSKSNNSRRILNEQEVGSSLIEMGTGRVQVKEAYQPQHALLNMPHANPGVTNSPIRNNGNTLGVYNAISALPTPLSSAFPVPLHMTKNENINATDISEKENTNTSKKVFPKINVLIVEDNVINQAILGSFLRKHKISYKIAKNGKEAVDIWKEGGLHLIFMDLQLPVLSGIDAAKQIRDLEKKKSKKHNAPVIIVALTASNSIEDKRKALVSGCNDYLTKPVNLHWLSKKITEWGCMQALIDFDSWKQGQSRMTENVIMKSPHKKSKAN